MNRSREALLYELNVHKDELLSRLPVEIISIIFVQSRPINPIAYTSNTEIHRRQLQKAVFALCHVSRKWRDIAFGTQALWTVFCAKFTAASSVSSITISREWLKRSRTLPLYIQLTMTHRDPVINHDIKNFIDLVAIHAHRCEVLDLDIHSRYIPQISKALSTKRLDRLDHLKLSVQNPDRKMCLRLQAVPRLLTLWSVGSEDTWSRGIRLEGLTHVTVVEHLKGDDLFRILENAPQLSFLRIRNANIDTHNNPLPCPSMRTLEVTHPSDAFWSNFVFPSLETLCIPGHTCSAGGCWTALQTHLTGTGLSVRQLEIRSYPKCTSQNRLVDVLRLLPNLERLLVRDGSLGEPLFSAMDAAATHSSPTFLSRLRSLECATHVHAFNWTELIKFLDTMTSRPNRSLHSFRFQYYTSDPEMDFVDADMFQLLMNAVRGMEFEVIGINGQDLLEGLRRRYLSVDVEL